MFYERQGEEKNNKQQRSGSTIDGAMLSINSALLRTWNLEPCYAEELRNIQQ